MEIFIVWLAFSLIVGGFGSSKTIGFWTAFIAAIILSPLIGAIIVAFSKDLQTDKVEKSLLEKHEVKTVVVSAADELQKLADLKEKGHITADEFNQMKKKYL